MTERREYVLLSIAVIAIVAVAVHMSLPDDGPNSTGGSGIIRQSGFTVCILGIPLVLMQHLCCGRSGSFDAGEFVWIHQGCWGVVFLVSSAFNITGFAVFMIFLLSQIIVFVISCYVLTLIMYDLTVNRRPCSWLELVGTLTGVVIPVVYAAALTQADIAV
jgi:hypothetical protein